MNKIEVIKQQKDGLDVLGDIYKYARLGFESIPEEDYERIKWYGLFHRRLTPGYFMMRLRIPNGMLSSSQLRVIGEIVNQYGRGWADITTRQNIQMRWIQIQDVPDIFERLESAKILHLQSGMDNVRNIVGCPVAGIDPNELIDASTLAKEIQDAIIGQKAYSNLPRKFNISISGCREDCGHAAINDIGLTPAIKVGAIRELPKGARHAAPLKEMVGFNLNVGGALGSKPSRFCSNLDVFVKPEDVAAICRSVVEIFRDCGCRETRTHTRLKFLLDDWGEARFRSELEARFGHQLEGAGKSAVLHHWGNHIGIHPQKQKGLNYVGLLVPVGRISGEQLLELSALADRYGSGDLRLTIDQNLIIVNVSDEKLEALESEPLIDEISPNPSQIMRGLVSCTGNDFCHFSLVDTKFHSLNIARQLEKQVKLDKPIRIHFSGCINSCGQHQIADIGLLGTKVKKDGEIVEAATVFFGGSLEGEGSFAKEYLDKIPCSELPELLGKLIMAFAQNARPNESFAQFCDRFIKDHIGVTQASPLLSTGEPPMPPTELKGGRSDVGAD